MKLHYVLTSLTWKIKMEDIKFVPVQTCYTKVSRWSQNPSEQVERRGVSADEKETKKVSPGNSIIIGQIEYRKFQYQCNSLNVTQFGPFKPCKYTCNKVLTVLTISIFFLNFYTTHIKAKPCSEKKIINLMIFHYLCEQFVTILKN